LIDVSSNAAVVTRWRGEIKTDLEPLPQFLISSNVEGSSNRGRE